MIFYNYFICYFIILIFCFAETLKILLYIIGITARKIFYKEKFTVYKEKSTEYKEKFTIYKEKSTEIKKSSVTKVRSKTTKVRDFYIEKITAVHNEKSP